MEKKNRFKDTQVRQKEIVDNLVSVVSNGQLSHAYIFEGMASSELVDVVHYVAAGLLCRKSSEIGRPCGECLSCQMIESGNHLNVIEVIREKNDITKDQVTELRLESFYKSIDNQAKVYIIRDAEKLNISASNSILKMLEEPFPNHYIFLLVSNANRLLDTIKSRAQLIRFRPINRKVLETYLIDHKIDHDFAYVLSSLANSQQEIDELVKDSNFINVYELAKDLIKKEGQGKSLYLEFNFTGKFLFDLDRVYNHYFLQILILIKQTQVMFLEKREVDHFVSIFKFSEWSLEKIINQIYTISQYQERIDRNVNLELMYASLFIDI